MIKTLIHTQHMNAWKERKRKKKNINQKQNKENDEKDEDEKNEPVLCRCHMSFQEELD